MFNLQSYRSYARLVVCLIAGMVILPMEGCGVAALPCRLVSATYHFEYNLLLEQLKTFDDPFSREVPLWEGTY